MVIIRNPTTFQTPNIVIIGLFIVSFPFNHPCSTPRAVVFIVGILNVAAVGAFVAVNNIYTPSFAMSYLWHPLCFCLIGKIISTMLFNIGQIRKIRQDILLIVCKYFSIPYSTNRIVNTILFASCHYLISFQPFIYLQLNYIYQPLLKLFFRKCESLYNSCDNT